MAPEAADPRSTGEVVRSLTENTQALLRKEIELAKLEITEAMVARGIAIGLAVAGAVLGLFILGFAGVTAATALALVVAPWLAGHVILDPIQRVAATRPPMPTSQATRPSGTGP